jgi:hypothetical protein
MPTREEIRTEVIADFKNQYSQWTKAMEDEEIDQRIKSIEETSRYSQKGSDDLG